MIKSKFGNRVRSKTAVAQMDEVLCKVLCHNLRVLVQSAYELGVEAAFWQAIAKVLFAVGSVNGDLDRLPVLLCSMLGWT